MIPGSHSVGITIQTRGRVIPTNGIMDINGSAINHRPAIGGCGVFCQSDFGEFQAGAGFGDNGPSLITGQVLDKSAIDKGWAS